MGRLGLGGGTGRAAAAAGCTGVADAEEASVAKRCGCVDKGVDDGVVDDALEPSRPTGTTGRPDDCCGWGGEGRGCVATGCMENRRGEVAALLEVVVLVLVLVLLAGGSGLPARGDEGTGSVTIGGVVWKVGTCIGFRIRTGGRGCCVGEGEGDGIAAAG